MILIGMFDSPFVRRVAVTLRIFEIRFEHRDWSVGKDFELIRRYNPLGRVPTLVLDDGEALIDSAAILDYLDEVAGTARALVPQSGRGRRDVLRIMAIAAGAAEKGVAQIYETVFRPPEKRHQAWLDRCAAQMHGALAELEAAAKTANGGWLAGVRMTQADITASCVFTFLSAALRVGEREGSSRYPNLAVLAARCESLPEFEATREAFAPPGS
jgi:glutathione S-transferase